MSKGHWRRPTQTPRSTIDANWQRTFGGSQVKGFNTGASTEEAPSSCLETSLGICTLKEIEQGLAAGLKFFLRSGVEIVKERCPCGTTGGVCDTCAPILCFIVAGQEYHLRIKTSELLYAGVLRATANLGHKWDTNWEARDSSGALLNVSRTVGDLGLIHGNTVWTQPRPGFGG